MTCSSVQPLKETPPQTINDPQPNLSVLTKVHSVYLYPRLRHTRTRLSQVERWNLLSSVNSTDSHSSILQSRCSWANSNLRIRWAGVNMGPIAEHLAFMPSSCNQLRIVWSDNRRPVAIWNSDWIRVAVLWRFQSAEDRVAIAVICVSFTTHTTLPRSPGIPPWHRDHSQATTLCDTPRMSATWCCGKSIRAFLRL